MFIGDLARRAGLRTYTPPEEEAYRRLAGKGYHPASIIDVGAYEGNWTRLARRAFPDATVLMVEPQTNKCAALDQVCRELPSVTYSRALLANEVRTVPFHEMETGSSMFPERSNAPRTSVTLETATLDLLAGAMAGPIFLKIDVQGAELEVLQGGEETLRRCDLVQLEVPIAAYNEGAPTMIDALSYMDQRGFVPLDISGYSRPNGVDLVQIDMLFVPTGSPLKPSFFEF